MSKRPLRIFGALIFAAACCCSASALAGRHALLIGISDYRDTGLCNLPGAQGDVERTKDVLKARLQFRDEEIRVFPEREATHTGMELAFAELAAAVQPGDFVYVHYSGHGSQVKDFNDQGSERGGWDQTLVGYGARRGDSQGLDRYDILDDELNRWLAPIADKAGEMVFVADSCHAATNTRGEGASFSRGAPRQVQEDHPHARDPYEAHPLTGAVASAPRATSNRRLMTPLEPADRGIAILEKNLAHYRRLHEMKGLAAEAGSGSGVAVRVVQYRVCPERQGGCAEGCVRPWQGGCHRPGRTLPVEDIAGNTWSWNAFVSFVLENRGESDRYVYLFELTPHEQVYVLFPRETMNGKTGSWGADVFDFRVGPQPAGAAGQ